MCDIGFEKTKGRGGTVNRMQKEPSKGLFKKDLLRNFAKFTTKLSLQKGFLKKCFEKFCKIHNKTSVPEFLFRYFIENFVKLRTPSLRNSTRRLLLIIAVSIVAREYWQMKM